MGNAETILLHDTYWMSCNYVLSGNLVMEKIASICDPILFVLMRRVNEYNERQHSGTV